MTDEELVRLVMEATLPKPPCRSLHRALELGLVPVEYMAEAIRIEEWNHAQHYYHRKRVPHRDASPNQDPSWDNLVRAMEEDR